MKNLILSLILSFTVLSGYTQTIEPAPADKAVVYFVRSSSLGFAINFTYFDGTAVIGQFNGTKYLRYECEPGEHLFWARSENKDFVKANLEAGKIYVIDVIPLMGAIKAAVELVPINSADYNLKRTQKLLAKRPSESFSKEELDRLQIRMADVIERGMKKYEKIKGTEVTLGEYTFEPEQLVFVKKERKKKKK